ncbi:hypothetical protein H6P81_010910 [Aristolochia fimbriata]|uniref:Uncharacterized protein n=1 Tax=Aristolochia fimbriata TaxID=158543 RepID=A0AAV7EQ40_ARIFI|nr:hypothetical protein H6P81_010910 [Aristolochia fimbriata]
MKSSLLAFVLFSFFLLCCSHSGALAITHPDYYYAVVLTWPASYCYQSSEGCCLPATGKPKLDFFVDSLLTYNASTGGVLTTCHGHGFSTKEISGLIEDLHKYWSDVRCPSREPSYNWRRVWNKYGVCSGLTQHNYFKKALALRNEADLLSVFRKNGIVPSGENLYKLKHIKRVLKESLGVSVGAECSKNMWGESQLYRVYLCLNQDASTIISCPVDRAFNCDDEVTFGLFTADMLTAGIRIKNH